MKTILFIVTIFLFGSVAFADSNNITINPQDVTAGTFGANQTLTALDSYIFNNQVYFNLGIRTTTINATGNVTVSGDIYANRFISRDDSSYRLVPNNVSSLGAVFADAYYTRSEGSSYYFIPAQNSRINNLTIDSGNVVNNCQEGVDTDYSALTCSANMHTQSMSHNGTHWTQLCCYTNN